MTQSEREGGEGERRVTAGIDLGPGEMAISHDWARRRLDLYDRMERAIREEISHALRTAAEIRTDVERDADAFLRRLGSDRVRLADEIAALQRERQQLSEELERRRAQADAELRQRREQQDVQLRQMRAEIEAEMQGLRLAAEQEAAQVRVQAQAQAEEMIREAEERRAKVAAEVRALEEQVAQIQGMIDSFLSSPLQALRGSLSALPDTPGTPVAAPGQESPGELQAKESRPGAIRQTAAAVTLDSAAQSAAARPAFGELASAATGTRAAAPPAPSGLPVRRPPQQAMLVETGPVPPRPAAPVASASHAPGAPAAASPEMAERLAGSEAPAERRFPGAAAVSAPAVISEAVAAAPAAGAAAPKSGEGEPVPAGSPAPPVAAASAPPEVAARRREAKPQRAGVVGQDAAAAAPPEVEIAALAPESPAGPTRREIPETPAELAAVEPVGPAGQASAPVEAAPAVAPEAAPVQTAAPATEAVPVQAPAARGAVPEARAVPVRVPGTGVEAAPSDGIARTSMVISGVPGFSRALALQRAIQQLPGVGEAKAIGYERGVLGLEVQHAPGIDLLEHVTRLPGIRLRVVEAAPGQVQLATE